MLEVYNTLTKKKEPFKPANIRKVTMFVCGQTVYDDAHLGHAKTYINFDIIVRWLRYSGFTVFYVQNITDVDDKIINRAKERNIEPMELAEHYTKRFFEDMKKLGVKKNVDLYPKSSDYIPQIIDQIQTLIKKGFAYVVDGDVYFDVSKFKNYTKLSGLSLDELVKHRIEPDPRKKNSYDFSLWKSQKSGEIAWNSPWSKGRPGWHIEDTAMTVSIFGPQYDLHGGANELIFPHHTNEIAQAEAATGVEPFVRYWLHGGVMNIGGKKMSKSLKNFITIRVVLERFDAEVLRTFYCSTHYRKPIDYDEKAIAQAQSRLDGLYRTLENLNDSIGKTMKSNPKEKSLLNELEKVRKQFTDAMNNDFNTPLALSVLEEFANKINKYLEKSSVSKSTAKKIADAFKDLGSVFGILQKKIGEERIPEEITRLVEQREEARITKDFKKSDEIRNKIKELGYLIEDTPTGVKVRKIKK